jgi:hypothetical protein
MWKKENRENAGDTGIIKSDMTHTSQKNILNRQKMLKQGDGSVVSPFRIYETTEPSPCSIF